MTTRYDEHAHIEKEGVPENANKKQTFCDLLQMSIKILESLNILQLLSTYQIHGSIMLGITTHLHISWKETRNLDMMFFNQIPNVRISSIYNWPK